MEIMNKRGALECLKKAVKNGQVSMGFLGGSITEGMFERNWPEIIRGWFVSQYPGVRLAMQNAASGATSSLFGAMQAQAEVIETGCDIVFVEYAVNDISDSPKEYNKSREGIVRQLLAQKRDVVFIYTFSLQMYQAMQAGNIPESISNFEMIAEHYNIPSVWSGKYAYDAVKAGKLSWEAWLPTSGANIHPECFGSSYYAAPIIKFLENEMEDGNADRIPYGVALPEPRNPLHFANIKEIPMSNIELKGPWAFVRETHCPWFRIGLDTSADSAGLSFRFQGRTLAAIIAFGKRSAVMYYRIDNGEWIESIGDRDWWVPEKDWCRQIMLADNLENKEHLFEMKIEHGNRPECKGCDYKIFKFMSVE